MQDATILWVDDEIAHLKSHILFLQQKGLQVETATNGEDAVERVRETPFDLIFLDENMPGISGLDALAQIKAISPHTPVIMITKSEEEDVMESAIGSKIADYLIKPVNPNQILHSVKKLLQGRELVGKAVNRGYQQDFRNITLAFFDDMGPEQWVDIYRKLLYWELELETAGDATMAQVLLQQKTEANVNFGKFYANQYPNWVQAKVGERPLLSPDILPQRVLPLVKPGGPTVFFLLIDCLRFDQYLALEPLLTEDFVIERSEAYFGILPTATQYARNALFAGLFPSEIAERFPRYWVHDDEEKGKNLFEAELLQELILRQRLNIKHSYTKVLTHDEGRAFAESVPRLMGNQLNAVVVNFIDLMTHARSEMSLVKELAPDEAGFRSLAHSWLEHSSLLTALRRLKNENVKIVLTTDHGSIRVSKPVRIVGDRDTTTNLRYKQGRNLNYEEKNRQIFGVRKPEQLKLPKGTVSASYAFALEDAFFVYPNNYNYYANHFKDTFQHGGISLEEVILPLVTLSPK